MLILERLESFATDFFENLFANFKYLAKLDPFKRNNKII